MNSGETAYAAPKGNAETLRQKDRIRTILCKVSQTHTEGATGFPPGISQVISAEAQRRLLRCVSFFILKNKEYCL